MSFGQRLLDGQSHDRITLDTVGGSLANGTKTITGSTGTAIVVQNSLALAPRFVVPPHHTDPGAPKGGKLHVGAD
ncbi:MAG: hypothetical protein Ct9H300mP1_14130 [Planctomycetaceae bacterium]|nr:MAG: hypothetical protein Ct9H300mP1_14130 [Planctomycetaceae bacterium]